LEVIPAVDIMRGKVVRLLRGDPKRITSYEHLGDPVHLAMRWEAEGARLIHVIDLDAALGVGRNLKTIKLILKSTKVPLQVGGGIRTLNLAGHILSLGVNRIILGSLAFSNPSAIETLINEFGWERVVVALDHKGGTVMFRGWKASSGISVEEAAENFREKGAKIFLVTSTDRDGTLLGPDVKVLSSLCRKDYRIIAAGGVRSIDDLLELKRLGVWGTVVGKALYEGKFSLGEALKAVMNS